MVVYGFFYNPCTHESADALISLHLTKKGAYNAMRQHKINSAIEERERAICHGSPRYSTDWRSWDIRAIEVKED